MLRWKCRDVKASVFRLLDSSVQPQVFNSKFEGDTPQAECFASAEKDSVSASQPNLYYGICNVAAQFECCRVSVKRITYFPKNSANLFVAFFSEMLALKSEDHLTSPFGPQKKYAALY
jgi:hypothetical protein